MDQNFKTSFIPKKPITGQHGTMLKKRSGASLFNLIAVIIFMVAVLSTVGVFVYKTYLQKSIDRQISELRDIRDRFDPAFVDEASRTSNRIEFSKDILNNHLSVTQLFRFLESNTLTTTQFVSFKYEYGKDGIVTIGGEGKGDSFNSVVLQSDIFGQSKEENKRILSNVLFDNVQRADDDAVFEFTAVLNPLVILYSNLVKQGDSQTNTAPVSESAEPIDQIQENTEGGATLFDLFKK